MVRTSTGPTNDKPPKAAEHTLTSEDQKVKKALNLNEVTWSHVEQMATSQSATPSEVVRRALEAQFGAWSPTSAGEAFNAR